ncbi:hypothetical protein HanPI659440_Chr05g0183711 [Helianthus annuus]|nr:hypothetical protein HanPI659440_Chr05g0183711 [Helianthus annuus]
MSREEQQSKKKKQKVELNALLPLATYDDEEEEEEEEEEEKKNGNQQEEEEDEEEEDGFGGQGGRRNRTIEVRRDCPYLDTVNRQVWYPSIPTNRLEDISTKQQVIVSSPSFLGWVDTWPPPHLEKEDSLSLLGFDCFQ